MDPLSPGRLHDVQVEARHDAAAEPTHRLYLLADVVVALIPAKMRLPIHPKADSSLR